jgi:hypothetical protein
MEREKVYHTVKHDYAMLDLSDRMVVLGYLCDERLAHKREVIAHADTAIELSKCKGERGWKYYWVNLTTAQATVIAAALASPVILAIIRIYT